ncbi:unnamed protein product [Acanthoscelides obtectus]|uniref:FYVE-type domain-containing protein n=1 Tax=Acanthoscelides obtectus TaxID=200917 RepID=A0A9P0L5R3_ACAOB|nr:unnamed protein product [Acanthoscelides obtectus]CAK1656761.1 Zinc finger FYVE domain-containing protein 26 homolog [Acanthoscelides obtectus]
MNCLEDVLKELERNPVEDSQQIIHTLSKIKCSRKEDAFYFYETILPKIYELYKQNLCRKDIFYLALLSNDNTETLQICLKYDKKIYKLCIQDTTSLYEYCIYKKQHWIEKLITDYCDYKNILSKTIYETVEILKLIQILSEPHIDFEQLKPILDSGPFLHIDPFWQKAIGFIRHFLHITKFCENLQPSLDLTELFFYASTHSVLETFSNYFNLNSIVYEDVLIEVIENESICENSKYSREFTAFHIFSTIFKCIKSEIQGINISLSVTSIKQKLLDIKDKLWQISLLQNIFRIIFVKSCQLKTFETKDEYICKEKDIRLILFLVKEILDELQQQQVYDKQSKEYKEMLELHKCVTDGLWRLELVHRVKNERKFKDKCLKYMLAPPESLIQMCLRQKDFERTYQVIKIFPLNNKFMPLEIVYLEKLQDLKDLMKKKFKAKAIQMSNPQLSAMEVTVEKTVEQFFKKNSIVVNTQLDEIVNNLSKNNNSFVHFVAKNEVFMNMFDIAVTQPSRYEDCETLLQLAFENNTLDSNVASSYSRFCKKILDTCSESSTSASKLLVSSEYYIDIMKQRKENEFYKELASLYDEFHEHLYSNNEPGTINPSHPSHRSLLKINKLCSEYLGSNTEGTRYLYKLFGYLKAFSKIFFIEQNTSAIVSKGHNSPYFTILDHNRSQLMGKLLFERKLEPGEFEKYFNKLKLDFLYHVIGNCFPTINLHTQDNVTKEELYPDVHLFEPSRSILAYIQKRNWLLAFLLIEMFEITDFKIDVSEVRVQVFLNYLNLNKIERLKVLHDNNVIITSLQNCINTQKVVRYINSQILKPEYMTTSLYSTTSNDSLETAEELLEHTLKTTNWKALYDILDSLPECRIRKNPTLQDLKDRIIVDMVQDMFEVEFYKYVKFINNTQLRIDTILNNLTQWPGTFCIDVLKREITRYGADENLKLRELQKWLSIIELNEELRSILNVSMWSSAHDLCEMQTERVIQKLMECSKINLLLDLIKLYRINDNLLVYINYNYFLKIFDTAESLEAIKLLLDNLPYEHSVGICYNLLRKLKQLDHLQFVVQYLMHNVDDSNLRSVELSLKMLTVFTQNELEQLLCLIYNPLSIIEILIMNTKLDKLSAVLNVVKPQVPYAEAKDNRLSIEAIDELLRRYAEKSLDFDVITNPNPRLLRTPEHKLMQSLDSINLDYDCNGFTMPEEVPSKEDWIPNSEVIDCMRCQKVTFSMFNRRHHCRRCGRVICYNCSMHRMQVPSYGDILVRVCEDCYQHTLGSEASDPGDSMSTKSVVNDLWLLSDYPEHNNIVREEFSYEHAPSVSLCLALMKYHSKTIEYPRFLLDQCKYMFELLLPSQEPTQEIDYFLVIKMLKSLTLAAKMSSVECNLPNGSSMADRILSQADLLSLLAERGCLNLLPITNTHSREAYIDAPILRRLRDKLLEREQWNLALEVSTKAGLDNTGIFATWGKSCLKAGCLQLAREKFQRCLDRNLYTENLDHTSCEDSISNSTLKSRTMSRLSLLSTCDCKPTKNPILLDEIVHILESNTKTIDKEILVRASQQRLSGSVSPLNQSFKLSGPSDVAITILNKLKNLKSTSAGQYQSENVKETSSNKPVMDRIFFDECVYYLTRYGSHLSLMEFYLRHGHFEKVLNYVLETQISAELFIDIYMRCLKDGIINTLQEHMSIIDSSLEVWKDYLRHLCRHLEKQNMLHSLYQLQQYMGDYIRAAMTCVRFYQENISTFSDLINNTNFLNKAEEHLKHVIEQEQWIEVAAVRKLSSASRDSFEEKGIVNHSLVMKMNSKDINKHINTIWLQTEVAKFLAKCETDGVKPTRILRDLQPTEENSSKPADVKLKIPTLFGTVIERIQLAVLVIICGKTVEEGYDLAHRIIQEFKLKPLKIYCESAKQLAKADRYSGIAELVSCIKHSGTSDADITDICDQMLQQAVGTLIKANVSETKVEDLIKLMSDKAMKISAYIEAKQLKTAYFLAVKYKRMADIRRISREAELLNQPSIKALCQKVLQNYSHTPSHSKE